MNQQHLILMGRATNDTEELESSKGRKFTKFGLAINEYDSDSEDYTPTYYNVVNFFKQPLRESEKVCRGDVVMVEGKPDIKLYTNSEGETKLDRSVKASYVKVFTEPSTIEETEE
jgi:single-stranded DNA-binding protein